MIKLKPKKCIECGREDLPHFSKKRCKHCAMKSYAKPKAKRVVKKESYRPFFLKCRDYYPNVCFESGERLEVLTVNCCHIFPKRKYKSVSRLLNNIIILSWENHMILDKYLDEMDLEGLKEKLPKTHDEILKRSKIILPLITETDGKLYNLIKEYVHKF